MPVFITSLLTLITLFLFPFITYPKFNLEWKKPPLVFKFLWPYTEKLKQVKETTTILPGEVLAARIRPSTMIRIKFYRRVLKKELIFGLNYTGPKLKTELSILFPPDYLTQKELLHLSPPGEFSEIIIGLKKNSQKPLKVKILLGYPSKTKEYLWEKYEQKIKDWINKDPFALPPYPPSRAGHLVWEKLCLLVYALKEIKTNYPQPKINFKYMLQAYVLLNILKARPLLYPSFIKDKNTYLKRSHLQDIISGAEDITYLLENSLQEIQGKRGLLSEFIAAETFMLLQDLQNASTRYKNIIKLTQNPFIQAYVYRKIAKLKQKKKIAQDLYSNISSGDSKRKKKFVLLKRLLLLDLAEMNFTSTQKAIAWINKDPYLFLFRAWQTLAKILQKYSPSDWKKPRIISLLEINLLYHHLPEIWYQLQENWKENTYFKQISTKTTKTKTINDITYYQIPPEENKIKFFLPEPKIKGYLGLDILDYNHIKQLKQFILEFDSGEKFLVRYLNLEAKEKETSFLVTVPIPLGAQNVYVYQKGPSKGLLFRLLLRSKKTTLTQGKGSEFKIDSLIGKAYQKVIKDLVMVSPKEYSSFGTITTEARVSSKAIGERDIKGIEPETYLQFSGVWRRRFGTHPFWINLGANIRLREGDPTFGTIAKIYLPFKRIRFSGILNTYHQRVSSLVDSSYMSSLRLRGSLSRGIRWRPLVYFIPRLGINWKYQTLDELPPGAKRVDLDIFSKFERDHPIGLYFQGELLFPPFLNQNLYLIGKGVLNSDFTSFDRVYLGVGTMIIFYGILVHPSYILSYRFKDRHREEPIFMEIILLKGGWFMWVSDQRLVFGLKAQVIPRYKIVGFGIYLTYDLNFGRGLRDWSPPEVVFRHEIEGLR
jgi:hypothetical protein